MAVLIKVWGWVLVLVTGVFLGGQASAQTGQTFPIHKGKDLTGARVTTEQFRGKPWLVVVGFERKHSDAMESWAKSFKAAFPDINRADYFEIAAMPGHLGFMRGFIDKQMAKGTPQQARNRVMTVYAADAVCRSLAIKDRKRIHLFVVDAEGRIVHREEGDPNPEALERLKAQISRLQPPA